MANFEDVLSKRSDTIEKPKPRPTGTYLAQLSGLPKQRAVKPRDGGDDMPVLDFAVKLLTPQANVDQEEVSALPPIHEWPTIRHSHFLNTENGVWNYRQWLINTLGIDSGEGKNAKTLGEMTAEAAGKQLLVTLKHEPFINRDGQAEIGANIESTAHV